MKNFTRKTLLSGSLLAALLPNIGHTAEHCDGPTVARQGEVEINKPLCMTDNTLYLHFNVPYENSDVTITVSGGTFSGTADAELYLYSGTNWSSEALELQTDTPNSNEESLSFTSKEGKRYFKIRGNIEQTNLLVSVSGGDIPPPPPLGDYVVYDTNVVTSIPAAIIASKAGFDSSVTTILSLSFSDYEAIASNGTNVINHVSEALHYLASTDDIADADLLKLLNFVLVYAKDGEPLTAEQAQSLSIAMQAVAKMSGFLSTAVPAGDIQESYTGAISNFNKGEGAKYFAEQLPHIMALVQFQSLLSNPFANDNYIDATTYTIRALGAAAYYGDTPVKTALNARMTEVLSVMRSHIYLGETAFDARYSDADDILWLVPTALKSLARIYNIAHDEAKQRIDSLIIELHAKLASEVDSEAVGILVNYEFLEAVNRSCGTSDPLASYCVTSEDVLSVVHQCSTDYTLHMQASATTEQLNRSCSEISEHEVHFHQFFGTQGTPLPNDDNQSLDIYAFSSPDDYKKYAGAFFGISTSNGGIYLEGDPAKPDDNSIFIAMVCDDDWVGNSCDYSGQIYNLKHEFTHYLDGRYNRFDEYKYYKYDIAWVEGMAEYLSQGNNYPRTLHNVKGKTIPPLYNIMLMRDSYDDLYQWAYFAMHYLANEHKAEVNLLAEALRAGDTDAYEATIKAVVTRTEAGFIDYVLAHSEAVAPKPEIIPTANEIGSCDLQQQYVSEDDAILAEVTVTNTTDTPISLFWIKNTTGDYIGSKNYRTLNQGDSFTSSGWRANDRMLLSDANLNCVGIAVMTQASNYFTIEPSLVENVVAETIPKQDQFGSCELVNRHIKDKDATGAFSVTNTTDYPVSIVRIDDITGKPLYSSNYGVLNQGESYSSPSWYGNRRFMAADARLNCIAVGVLNNENADYTIDETTIAEAAELEGLPEPNTIGSCDLIEKHYIDEVGYPLSIVNDSDTPVRIYRVLNETGEVNFDKIYATLQPGEEYAKEAKYAWYGKRRAVIATETKQCLGVAIFSQPDSINSFSVSQDLIDNAPQPADSDGDGVIDSEDAFPHDPSESVDSDSDGVGDNRDAFPHDATETTDSDNDGTGDNSDAFPSDPNETKDSDNDGIGDNADTTPNGVEYCMQSADKQSYEWITGVAIANINHSSGKELGGYSDFTQQVINLDAGSNQAITLTTNNDSDSEYWYVWIDFNQDGDFDDSNELVVSDRTSANTLDSSINVPATASGKTRMRVALSYRSIDGACNTISYGEVEDYSVQISTDDDASEPTEPTPSTVPDACATQSPRDRGRLNGGEAVCLADDNSINFSIPDVDSHRSIAITTAHGKGDISLNYNHGSWSNSANSDGSSANPNSSQECIYIPAGNDYWGYLEISGSTGGSTVILEFDTEGCR
ncbi:Dihydroxyacid dehydratase/phosphogluconate dehydratase [Shewanella piezotolerans WP3]|uniref:Dihydroxyacid dehydratase/phosphogluconate dehydratase n=1 Tax=Shewanella piezotolerans (strain WP3 / JCM 13877) TaxID=225849 RepID=B8CUZ7_SHEPW|nr:collagenase [Shewanella piezotolerans]ACJ31473.1 Dihydroxyacid dehydratase/phosphogluconate dehydratase [Shewanella piezotolerans WP3]